MTNEELKKLSNDTFFDNDTGEIQPEAHRNFNNHLIDHTETVAEAALRNAKEYTDARETAILAAADAKDESTLRTAKEYADRIVAALAGSAPDLLNTLEELAAALNNDPDFAAKVMQQISERVTKEAMEEALEEKAEAPQGYTRADLNELYRTGLYTVEGFGASVPNAPMGTKNCRVIVISGHENRTTQITQMYESDRMFFRRKNEGSWSPWVELWHSGNFDPATVFRTGGYISASQLDDNAIAAIGNKTCVVDYGGHGGLLVSISDRASAAPLQFLLSSYSKSASLQWRHGVDANRFEDPSFRTIWDSGNLKPTYYAQIDPLGGIISKSADWIQSVTWKSDGNGMQCYILPKMAVNLATAHVTKVRTYGNVFKGRAPVVCDELLGGCIVVATPGDNGASEKDYFNISIQGE